MAGGCCSARTRLSAPWLLPAPSHRRPRDDRATCNTLDRSQVQPGIVRETCSIFYGREIVKENADASYYPLRTPRGCRPQRLENRNASCADADARLYAVRDCPVRSGWAGGPRLLTLQRTRAGHRPGGCDAA